MDSEAGKEECKDTVSLVGLKIVQAKGSKRGRTWKEGVGVGE